MISYEISFKSIFNIQLKPNNVHRFYLFSLYNIDFQHPKLNQINLKVYYKFDSKMWVGIHTLKIKVVVYNNLIHSSIKLSIKMVVYSINICSVLVLDIYCCFVHTIPPYPCMESLLAFLWSLFCLTLHKLPQDTSKMPT